MTDPDKLWPFQLCRGHSKSPAEGACLLDAVSWFEYGCLGDKPKCVSPVLALIGHLLNDLSSDAERQELRQFIPLLPGTAGDAEADELRADWLEFAWMRMKPFWARAAFASLKIRLGWMDPPPAFLANEDAAWAPDVRSPAKHSYERTAATLSSVCRAWHYAGDTYRQEVHHLPISFAVCKVDKLVPNTSAEITTRVLGPEIRLMLMQALQIGCAIGRKPDAFDFRRVPERVAEFERARVAA